jgi:SNF2 family DNA or RNA helicase
MENFEEFDIEELKQTVLEMQKIKQEQDSREYELREKIAALQKQMFTLSQERQEIEQGRRDTNFKLQSLTKKLDSATRLQLVKEEQDRLRKEFEERAAELDTLTKDKAWRTGIDGMAAFDFQILGGKRLAVAKRGILGDKRGLGKTLTSLIWADMVGAKRVLVLAPNDVVPQFENEIRTWAPDRTIFSLRGLPKSQRDFVYPMLNLVDQFIVTLNYEAWRKDKTVIGELLKAGIDTIICDEAHRIKSSDKVTARGVFQIIYRPNYCPKCEKYDNFMGDWTATSIKTDLYPSPMWTCPTCSEKGIETELTNTIQNVLCMTGTPILNKPQEMFSLLFCVNRIQFPSERRFLDDYCYQYAPNRWSFTQGGLPRLTKFIKEFFLQRNRDDVGIDVPPPSITVHTLQKDKVNYAKQYAAEEALTKKAALILEDGTRKDMFFILEMILRERQLMTWPAGIRIVLKDDEGHIVDVIQFDVQESQKMDAALELLEELVEEGERVVIFSQCMSAC